MQYFYDSGHYMSLTSLSMAPPLLFGLRHRLLVRLGELRLEVRQDGLVILCTNHQCRQQGRMGKYGPCTP